MENTNKKVHSDECGNEKYHLCEWGCKRLVKCSEFEHLVFLDSIRCSDCADR